MNAQTRYRSPTAFRAALEQRLRHEAQESGIALNRLRKEAAFNRLLVRLYHTAPQMWALKGGLALIARLGAQVRATKDADANWRSSREELEDTLDAIEDLDMSDWFSFQVGDGHTLQGEGEEGALRYPVSPNSMAAHSSN
jgi:predicted nucleotidyltransferase component of viral defense system